MFVTASGILVRYSRVDKLDCSSILFLSAFDKVLQRGLCYGELNLSESRGG